MSNHYQLKDDKKIYFMEVYLKKKVHVMGGGIGFTDNFYTFAIGATPKEAEKQTRQYYQGLGATVSRVKATACLNQDINRYVFPEKMPGFHCAIQQDHAKPRSSGMSPGA